MVSSNFMGFTFLDRKEDVSWSVRSRASWKFEESWAPKEKHALYGALYGQSFPLRKQCNIWELDLEKGKKESSPWMSASQEVNTHCGP